MQKLNDKNMAGIKRKNDRIKSMLKLLEVKPRLIHELAAAMDVSTQTISLYQRELYPKGCIDRELHGNSKLLIFVTYDNYETVIPERNESGKLDDHPIELPFDRKLSLMMGYTDFVPQVKPGRLNIR